jgi:hypothetical protein
MFMREKIRRLYRIYESNTQRTAALSRNNSMDSCSSATGFRSQAFSTDLKRTLPDII